MNSVIFDVLSNIGCTVSVLSGGVLMNGYGMGMKTTYVEKGKLILTFFNDNLQLFLRT